MNLGGGKRKGPNHHLRETQKPKKQGQILETDLAYALGKKIHLPIMSKLWGLGGRTHRQTDHQTE